MKLWLVFLVPLFVGIFCQDKESIWKEYKKLHGKDYNEKLDGGKQENLRKAIFFKKDAKIREHNKGNHSYRLGHNQFSDRTDKELAGLLGTTSPPSPKLHKSMTVLPKRQARLPDTLNYRNSYCLPPVKRQGSCGSCWAFTAITPLEFDRCRKKKSFSVLSEQQLIDCDTNSTNKGCSGGWYVTAWTHLQAVNGSASEFCYPYEGLKGTCRFCAECKSMVGAKVSSFGYVQSMNATAMQLALQEYGPLATAMAVVGSFYSYKEGVYDDKACDNLPVNHGVVTVGYGRFNNTIDYWVVRNTWGRSWGDEGYILIQRGVNKCSIETYPAFVVAL
ncbi:hypothetical protein GHT06_014815 [Daphnia sinensis]|uniref:Uncharacterized protein n=1 Tax=Daphnia sinensis TaxID=1820382 RepID=A0AAD5PSP6_9CRUS|nr:hypothetical protein GHT06_014815 [Daphnia sinensis]